MITIIPYLVLYILVVLVVLYFISKWERKKSFFHDCAGTVIFGSMFLLMSTIVLGCGLHYLYAPVSSVVISETFAKHENSPLEVKMRLQTMMNDKILTYADIDALDEYAASLKTDEYLYGEIK